MKTTVTVWKNFAEILTLENAYKKDGRMIREEDLSIIQNGTVVFETHSQTKKAVILWVGADKHLPMEYQQLPARSFAGHVLTPEVVDSHTHLIFAGDRAREYTQRLNGVSYQDIAKAGGGILYTVKSTQVASEEDLWQSAIERIERIRGYGVTTIEVKSGYGLDWASEEKISRLIHKLKKHFAPEVQIFNTFMAAHAIPLNHTADSYIDELVIPLMQKLAQEKIIDAVDIFTEEGYFTAEQTRRLFAKASELSLAKKIHADEFTSGGGASLACEYGALSADHLLQVDAAGIKALAQSPTVATLLPGTALFLGKPLAPARKLLDAGAKVAMASDYNPGSCHCDNLLLLAQLALTQYKMHLGEFWTAITLNGAAALGLRNQGAIIPQMAARFSIFKAANSSLIPYSWGRNLSVRP